MNTASISDIKKELQSWDEDAIRSVCLRLAKYKKENKELLNYLLFEAHDERAYINSVKEEIETMFGALPKSNVYFVKKSLRKILRFVNRQIKYSGIAETELEIRIFFCISMRKAKVPLAEGTVLYNMYQQQYSKVISVFDKLPEDLQADYERETETIAL